MQQLLFNSALILARPSLSVNYLGIYFNIILYALFVFKTVIKPNNLRKVWQRCTMRLN